MNESMPELISHRGELRARIAEQREQMNQICTELRKPLAYADKGVDVVYFLRAHPLLIATIAAILMNRRRSAAGLLSVMWWILKGFGYLNNKTSRLFSRT
jgi:hypothetical protein